MKASHYINGCYVGPAEDFSKQPYDQQQASLMSTGRARRAVFIAKSKYDPTVEDAKKGRRQ